MVIIEVLLLQYNTTMFFGLLSGPDFVIYIIAAVSKRIFLRIECENREGA